MTALRTTLLALSTMAAAAFGGTLDASAQAYPNQVVRIIVPFSAGSITDGLARILADKLGDLWKQQVIVENRPGLPGTTAVAKSALEAREMGYLRASDIVVMHAHEILHVAKQQALALADVS